MDGSETNNNRFQKTRNTELTIVLTLLFLALIAGGYLFLSKYYINSGQHQMSAASKAQGEANESAVNPEKVKKAFTSLDSLNNKIGETIRELNDEISEDSEFNESAVNTSHSGDGFDCWIVTGLFSEKVNADNMIQRLKSAGYSAETIERENGALAVGIPALSKNRELLEEVRSKIAKDAYFFRKE